jgi:hypothetical protein
VTRRKVVEPYYWAPDGPWGLMAAKAGLSVEETWEAFQTLREVVQAVVKEYRALYPGPSSAPPAAPAGNVSEADLVRFLKNTASKEMTKEDLFKLAKNHFEGAAFPPRDLRRHIRECLWSKGAFRAKQAGPSRRASA